MNIREEKIKRFADANYPNAQITEFDGENTPLTFYKESELENADVDWFPLSCTLKDGELVYGGCNDICHTYLEGETGAGKTTRFVMQCIRALSSTKAKPSFLVVDIHGEIIENLYIHLKKMGYNIKILNCDNAARSDTYNPLLSFVKDCVKEKEITPEASRFIEKLAQIMQPIKDKSQPMWEQGARQYLKGLIQEQFEALLGGGMPEECVSIYNIIENHFVYRREKYRKLKELESSKLMETVLNTADRTRDSFFATLESYLGPYFQSDYFRLTTDSTIDVNELIDRPTVFVVQAGVSTVGAGLVSIMMNDIYETVVKRGRMSPDKRLPRNVHCFLDEFANCEIGEAQEFVRMLTTSRKFGMRWHMILQCDAQLDRKFDDPKGFVGRIVRANSTEIYMGSQDYDTQKRFAESCGKRTVESLETSVTGQFPRLEQVATLSAEKIALIEHGTIYVKLNRKPLLKSYVEAFYNCPQFESMENIEDVYPENNFDYKSTRFIVNDYYGATVPSEAKFLVLMSLKEQPKTTKELQEKFPVYNIPEIEKDLAKNKMLSNDSQGHCTNELPVMLMRRFEKMAKDGLIIDDPNDYLFADSSDDDRAAKEFIAAYGFDVEPVSLFAEALFDDLKSFFAKKADLPEMWLAVKKMTCVPCEFMRMADDVRKFYMRRLSENRIKRVDYKDRKEFEYEIIIRLLKNNKTESPQYIREKIRDEVELMRAENLFPDDIIKIFESACETMRKETDKNIEELKKAIDKIGN